MGGEFDGEALTGLLHGLAGTAHQPSNPGLCPPVRLVRAVRLRGSCWQLHWSDRASLIPNHQYWTYAHRAVALALAGDSDKARTAASDLLARQPRFTRDFAEQKLFYVKDRTQLSTYLNDLKRAGIPKE